MHKINRPKLLLPFIHYRLELPEVLQGMLMIAVGLSTVSVLQQTLGLSYGAALAAVFLAEALGLLHCLFGDPVVPGWIASALSLVLVYLGGYTVGIDSIHALIALQLLVGVLFLVLGATGVAKKLVAWIPASLKAGILLGAAIAAMSRVLGDGGYLSQYPWSVGAGAVAALLVLFSTVIKGWKQTSRTWREITKYGMLSSLVVSMAVGFASGELALPRIQWGITPLSFGELFATSSVFAVGLPSLGTFLAAIPTALSVYIIAFGEIITAESVLGECRQARPNEPLPFSANRTNVITGVRNVLLALVSPFTALAGPLWAAVTVSIGERYKESGSTMKTLFGGIGSFKLSTCLCILLLPLTSLLTPVLPVALAVTLVVQGFACSYMAVEQVKDDRSAAGVAGLTGMVVYFLGSGWGIAVGLTSWLLVEGGYQKLRTKLPRHYERKRKTMESSPCIALEQELYAGGGQVACLLAQALHVPCYEAEILTTASRLSRIPVNTLRRWDGVIISPAYDLQADDESQLRLPTTGQVSAAQIAACRALSDQGSCVLVDHNAAAAVQDRTHLSVFLTASPTQRLQALQSKNPKANGKTLSRLDRKRARYHRLSQKTWGQPDAYDLYLDMTTLTPEAAVQQIMARLAALSGTRPLKVS